MVALTHVSNSQGTVLPIHEMIKLAKRYNAHYIGKGSTIGGNVWLTRSVPPISNVSQARPRSEVFDEGSGI